MITIAGYDRIEQIYESANSYVYRGRQLASQQPVILKVLKQNYPTPAELTRYKQEYAITRQLNFPGVIQALSFQRHEQTWVMVLEDFGGESLEQLSGDRPWSLPDFFSVAIPISEILGRVHAAQVIHKDINPANILWNRQTGQVKLIDFGISTQFGREHPTLKHPHILEGTLAYLSPEQTGRMNRLVDYRSDYYSLGITFYQLLTGQLPFPTQDPLELVHCHIAKQPPPPHTLNAQVPLPLSQLVMKLMAKTSEERYQSAGGIQADLQHCWAQFSAQGTIEPFPLATQDFSDRFQIPQKLYGRAAEVTQLLTAFEQIAAGTTALTAGSDADCPDQLSDQLSHQLPRQLLLIAGYSGIGKSSLVQELYKPVTRSRGAFISGKFDQFQRNVPYSAIVAALRELVRQLLAAPHRELQNWRDQLQTALGTEGAVIVAVIPEIERIIGSQPPVPELPPTEAQTRFNQVFQRFMQVFCSAEHPLVLFLDDLQWADAATLKLIDVILTRSQLHHLLLIGAYRDNEVDPSHPLMLAIADLRKANVNIRQITLTPLDLEQVSHLVADTLHTEQATVRSIAEFLIKQTGGNPFFVGELLKTLHQEALLTFRSPSWYWDMEQITARGITDNVVELMIDKLKQLPEATQQALSLAACVGASFDLTTLTIICQRSPLDLYADLLVAIQPGLILTQSELDADLLIQEYRFGHDRIQQAAYALIDTTSRQAVHLKIGRLLLQDSMLENSMLENSMLENSMLENSMLENSMLENSVTTSNTVDHHATEVPADRLFEIVDHLNLGIEQVSDPVERFTIAQLNLKAAEKAKNATAYEAALSYAIASQIGVNEATWQTNFEWMLNLYRERTDLEFLNGHFTAAQAWIDRTLDHARTDLERADIYIHRMVLYTLSGRYHEALSIGYQAAAVLGIPVPQGDPTPFIQAGMAEITAALTGKSIASLVDLPPMTDPVKKLSMKLFGELIPTSYLARQELFPWVNVMMVQFSLQYGLHPDGFVGFACYGMILASEVEAYADAYEFGKVALTLSQRWNDALQTCRACHILSSFLVIWVQHVRESGDIKRLGGKADLTYAGYNQAEYLANLWFEGQSLPAIAAEIEIVQLDLQKFANQYTETITAAFRFSVWELLDQPEDQILYCQQTLTEAEFIQHCETQKLYAGLCTHSILRCILAYLTDDLETAYRLMRQAEALILARRATMIVPVFYFYSCLVLAERYATVDAIAQAEILAELQTKQQQLQTWSASCPENFEHLADLVSAEIARCTAQPLVALELYDRGIASAQAQGFIHHAALGNELATRFWLARGKTDFARLYCQRAHHGYQHWGATRKVDHLEQTYPELLRSSIHSSFSGTVSPTTTSAATRTNGSRTSLTSVRNTSVRNTSVRGTTMGDSLSGLLDFKSILKASQALSSELVLKTLLEKLIQILIENAGAQSGYLLLAPELDWTAEPSVAPEFESLQHWVIGASSPAIIASESQRCLSLEHASDRLPTTLIYYVARTQEPIILSHADTSSQFAADPYIQTQQPKSILCTAILHHQHLIGVLYLENNLTPEAFTHDRLEVVDLLTSQAAISLQNALLYDTLEQKVEQRTQELHANNQSLTQALAELQHTQSQLIQSEKMSSLGQMVAGVAHEINNPVNFIHGNLSYAEDYINDLLRLINLYQTAYPQPTPSIAATLEDLDLDFMTEDLGNLLRSMRVGSNRIREIVLSLRNFSRIDEAEFKAVDIHEGIESTLLILQHRLNPAPTRQAIVLLKDYDPLPLVECYPGQLNQVLMNILANAIDALEEHAQVHPHFAPTLTIRTTQLNPNWIQISIVDNGTGIPEPIQQRIFDPFFTTKPVGKGTGMGMSISYQIITEKHGGKLECFSTLGEGTEFVIQIPVKQSIAAKPSLAGEVLS